jgi:hypothetical protein
MPSLDEEIERLQRENDRLRAQLDQNQGPVRILAPENRAVMPSRLEMRQLFDAVATHWPNHFLTIAPDEFERAFKVLGTFHRQTEINSAHYAYHWTGVAKSRGVDVPMPAFLCAVLAWGDVPLVDWRLKDEGVVLAFGLNEFVGRLPRDEWRRTLRGEFAVPLDPRPKRHMESNAPRPVVLVDGRPLPDQMRYVGPRYEVDY